VDENERISLENICGGAVEELFQRELADVLANIGDVNTDPEQKRRIKLEFTLKPFEDRSGAQIDFSITSKQAAVRSVKGTMFMQRKGSELVAINRDPKQSRLFVENDNDHLQ
jgi:hypothetical protein